MAKYLRHLLLGFLGEVYALGVWGACLDHVADYVVALFGVVDVCGVYGVPVLAEELEVADGGGEADPHLARIGKDVELERTTIGWISVEELTGKKSAEVKF